MGALYVVGTLLPLVAFAIEAIGGRRLGRWSAYLATGAIMGAFVLATIGGITYISSKPDVLWAASHDHHHDEHGEDHGAANAAGAEEVASHADAKNPVIAEGSVAWATFAFGDGTKPLPGPTALRVGYRIDNISVMMFFMVTLIASCIHVYSIGYMSHEPRFSRFFTYLSLFCFSMLNLIIADNFFQIFISWELVGVCSYLLIGFYYEKRSASNAANKAFITNRIGDVGFIVGLMAIWANFGTFQFSEIFVDGKLNPELVIDPFWLTVAGIGIFVGCVGKSAQFPLHVWLPDAMEGPTPVSALIHAATMVAAGVYLVARVFPLFTPEAQLLIAYVGGITLFVAATIAIVATDIKKALAYSTVSQLGYMMMALGIGGWVAGLMHLITHAFFKALLFLCSGSVIHGTGTQEMPQMGGLAKKMPWTAFTMLVGVLAIAGCPFFSGFYSKDAIIAQVLAYGEFNWHHVGILLMPIVSAGITSFYIFRLWFMTFAGTPRDEHVHDHAHESPPSMVIPLLILAFFSIIAAGIPWFPLPTPTLESFIAFGQPAAVTTGTLGEIQARAHALHGQATLVASGLALTGFLLAAAIYWFRLLNPDDARRAYSATYQLFANKWYFDEIYRQLLVRPVMRITQVCAWFDRAVIDWLVDGSAKATVQLSRNNGRFDLGIVDGLVNLIADVAFSGGRSVRQVQTGWLRGYVGTIALGAAALLVLGSFFFI